MSNERLRAIILRRTNYGEADRVLALLTPSGRRSVIARGVRREKSKLAGGIELFAISDVVIVSGRGNLDVLTSARLERFFGRIIEDYDRLQFGYESTNAVARASEQVDSGDWFEVLAEVYDALDDSMVPLQLIQTWFYLRYAEATGYQFNLERDVAGSKLEPEKVYMYDLSEKALRPTEQGDITGDHIKFLRLVASKPLRAVAQVGGVEAVLAGCWLAARQHAAI